MKKSTILVVDDELFFRRLYTEILTDDGLKVEAAASGDEALDRLRQGGIDLVVTDMVMPGLSGLEVLRGARSMDPTPEVILVTGHASLETAIQALKIGARDYLIKPFDPEELRHLVHNCLEQRRLLDENTLLKSQIGLYQRGQRLASMLETERLLPEALKIMLRELGGGFGFATLLSADGQPRLLGREGVEEEEALAMAASLVHRLGEAQSVRLLKKEDLEQDRQWPRKVETACLLPLRCKGNLQGGVVICNAPGCTFPDPIPWKNLVFLSQQTTLAFENAYRYQNARQLMHTDDLTGLFNHRYLQIILDQEIRRAKRYAVPFTLVFIDLDNFKSVNDTYGHLAGSSVLKEVAGLLKECVREVDILFRYGGDEFTALLVGTDSQGAGVVAERIRKGIEKHPFATSSGESYHITATVGYATFPENAASKTEIIDLADRAMYDGKLLRNVSRGAWEIVQK